MKTKLFTLGLFCLAMMAYAVFSPSSVQATELIGNPSFETTSPSMAPWYTQNATAGWWNFNNSAGAHSGSRYEYIGVGSDGVTTANNVEDVLYQDVAIPSGTTSSAFTFWLKSTTDDTSGIAHDTLAIEVRNTANTVLQTIGNFSNASANNAWVQQSYTINGYAGQTIRIAFHGKTDASIKTVFRIDDVSLQPTVSVNYTISVSASPSAGGIVGGGGTFASGSSQTVTATANSGYAFANWTENGSVVSSSSSYNFTLNANRTLVANFTPASTADYPGAIWKGPPAASNFEANRGSGNAITYIIVHTTEGSMASALSTFQTPAAAGHTGPSSHYIIGTNGTVWQVVHDADTAYHCGNLTYNYQSIGIEQEGWASGNPDFSWQTDAQRTALENLINWLHTQYGVPLDRAHIIGHNQVPSPGGIYPPSTQWGGYDNHYDPGAWFNWRRVMTELGHAPAFNVVNIQTAASITTLPQSGAPIIVPATPGQKYVAYDYYNGYYLVFLSGYEIAQTGLGSGEHHWDGWIPAANVVLDTSSSQLEVTNAFPLRWIIHSSPSLSAANVGETIDGKRYVATGNTAIADGYTWREFYIATTANAVATGWVVTNGLSVIGGIDTTPPTVSITSPASGTTYTTAQSVLLIVSASDSGGLSEVDYYDGAAFMGSNVYGPYAYSWPITSANNGTHSWTARAYDTSGNVSTSSVVSVTVNIPVPDTMPPSLTISSPANGAVVTSASLPVSGTASDNGLGNNGISSVTVNGASASGGTASGTGTASWSATLTLVSGINTVTVVAKDTLNNTNQQQITVTYNPPRPVFGGSAVIGGKLQTTLTGLSTGEKIVFSVSTDLKNWNPIQTNVLVGSTLTFTNTIIPSVQSQFIRAMVQ